MSDTPRTPLLTAAGKLIEAMIDARQDRMQLRLGPFMRDGIDHGEWSVKVERMEE
ncbi:hypothetical protein [Pelagibius sp.]|uniref:hypothetical protein n=1 Tax=Pelagibius sp. TaxID=1931238 RepID=UPI003BAEBC10